jgi:hypothetical protein
VKAAQSMDGVGFVFTADDPYAGADFDRSATGEFITPHVERLVALLDS